MSVKAAPTREMALPTAHCEVKSWREDGRWDMLRKTACWPLNGSDKAF